MSMSMSCTRMGTKLTRSSMKPSKNPRPSCLKSGALRPGDIILTTSSAKTSAYIRTFTKSDISHAMLCVSDGGVIDSTAEGVQARNPDRIVVEPGYALHVLRPASPLTEAQLEAVIRFARERVSMPYTKVGAVQSILKKGKVTRHQFCSRLVAQAYREAGVLLVPDADRCTPAELLSSPQLVEVKDVLREISPEEEAERAAYEDRTQLMRDVTNALVNGARKVSSRIETLNDIDDYLKDHPESDAELCQVLQASGYLDVWRGEEQRNPWQYDIDEMDRRPHAAAGWYCQGVLADERLGINRFVFNLVGYRQWHAETGSNYFGLMVDLYTSVAEQHARRVNTAVEWLKRHGYLAPAAGPRLRPHTKAWFESLSASNPAQAAMTQIALQAAGSAEACSVCGDDPAADYVLLGQVLDGPGTIRLCADCHTFRALREPMEPLP